MDFIYISCLCATGEKCGAACTSEQFTCANGCCVDPGLECDSVPQCSDSSDEQNCKDCKFDLEFMRGTSELLGWERCWLSVCSVSGKQVWRFAANPGEGTKRYIKVIVSHVPNVGADDTVWPLVPVHCTEPPDTGSCRDSITKWYYNPLHQECFRFNYGGCQGNENRFDLKDSCLNYCRGVTGTWTSADWHSVK